MFCMLVVQDMIRAEDGRRAEAEQLYLKFNKTIYCPSCKSRDSLRGTLTKGSAGMADSQGRRYRRFVCRSGTRCGASIGVTQFITLYESASNSTDRKFAFCSIFPKCGIHLNAC